MVRGVRTDIGICRGLLCVQWFEALEPTSAFVVVIFVFNGSRCSFCFEVGGIVDRPSLIKFSFHNLLLHIFFIIVKLIVVLSMVILCLFAHVTKSNISNQRKS